MADDEILVPEDALERMERRAEYLGRRLRGYIEAGESRDARTFAQAWSIAAGVLCVVKQVHADESPPLWKLQAVSLVLEAFAEDKSHLVGFDD